MHVPIFLSILKYDTDLSGIEYTKNLMNFRLRMIIILKVLLRFFFLWHKEKRFECLLIFILFFLLIFKTESERLLLVFIKHQDAKLQVLRLSV